MGGGGGGGGKGDGGGGGGDSDGGGGGGGGEGGDGKLGVPAKGAGAGAATRGPKVLLVTFRFIIAVDAVGDPNRPGNVRPPRDMKPGLPAVSTCKLNTSRMPADSS